jgi:ankyrin repeat protein
MCEKWDLVPWLLEIGCDVISGNNEWETPLTYTVKAEKFRPDIAELLVQHGACVNTCDSDDKNILELAATPESREWLIAHGCTGESPEQPEEPIKILQRYGISDVEDSQKLLACLYERADTPLAYDFLQALLDQVWYLSKMSRRDELSRTDEKGRTLLMRQCALQYSSAQVIKVLHNYRPSTDFDLQGNSALWYALKSGNIYAAMSLYCDDNVVTMPGKDGLRPLDLMYGLPPWVLRQILGFNEGYPYDIEIRDGLSVLDRAMLDAHAAGQRFLVEVFIQAGARKELLPDS